MRDPRLHVGTDRGGDGAFIFADNRPCFATAIDRQRGRETLHGRFRGELMRRIAIGVQKRNQNAFSPRLDCRRDGQRQSGLIQRRDHATVGADPSGNAEHHVARNERVRTFR